MTARVSSGSQEAQLVALESGRLYGLSRWGADGTGDDTAAINQALRDSAEFGYLVVADPTKTYTVESQGSKAFLNPVGATITKEYAVQVPDGARVDWRGATLHTADVDVVALSNEVTNVVGDTIECSSVRVTAGGRAEARGVPLVWFWGLQGGRVERVDVSGCHFVAGQLSACDGTFFDELVAHAVNGQGWILGGNTSDRITGCEVGTVRAWDCASEGTFNQPGNGIVVGCDGFCSFRLLAARNCGGGNKVTANGDAKVGLSMFDGAVVGAEGDNGTQNSGTKVQGDDLSTKAAATIDRVVSRNCTGMGLYVRNAGKVAVGLYESDNNSLAGANADLDIDTVDHLHIGQVNSTRANWIGANLGSGVQRFTYGSVTIIDPNSLNLASGYGIACAALSVSGGPVKTIDTRGGSAKMSRGINVSNASSVLNLQGHEASGYTGLPFNDSSGAAKVYIGSRKYGAALGFTPNRAPTPVVASDYQGSGVSDNTALLNALAAAIAERRALYIDRRAADWVLTQKMLVDGQVEIFSHGASIRQSTWGEPVFEVRGVDDVAIHDLVGYTTEVRATIPGSYDLQPARDHNAVVYATDASRTKVYRVRGDGFGSGVFFRGHYDNASIDDDNSVWGCHFTTVDQGVLYMQQRRLQIARLKAKIVESQAVAGHAIYGTGSASQLSFDTEVSDCVGYDGLGGPGLAGGGHQFQFKFNRGLTGRGLIARNSGGTLIFQDCEDCDVAGVVGIDDQATSANHVGSVRFNLACARIRAEVEVNQIAGATAYLVSTDGGTSDLTIIVKGRHWSTSTGQWGCRIDGTNNALINPEIEHLNTKGRAFAGIGTGTRVLNPKVKNAQTAFDLTGGTGQVIDFDPDLLDSSLSPVLTAQASTVIKVRDARQVLAYGVSITVDPTKGRTMTLNVTNGTAFTIANPVNGVRGPIVLDIKNSSAGAMGAITWGAQFLLAGAFTNPATGKRRTISFHWDGTNWVELWRSGADI